MSADNRELWELMEQKECKRFVVKLKEAIHYHDNTSNVEVRISMRTSYLLFLASCQEVTLAQIFLEEAKQLIANANPEEFTSLTNSVLLVEQRQGVQVSQSNRKLTSYEQRKQEIEWLSNFLVTN